MHAATGSIPEGESNSDLALRDRILAQTVPPWPTTILQPYTRPIQSLWALTRSTKHPKVPEPNGSTTSQTVLDDVDCQQSQPHRNHPVHPGTFRTLRTAAANCPQPQSCRRQLAPHPQLFLAQAQQVLRTQWCGQRSLLQLNSHTSRSQLLLSPYPLRRNSSSDQLSYSKCCKSSSCAFSCSAVSHTSPRCNINVKSPRRPAPRTFVCPSPRRPRSQNHRHHRKSARTSSSTWLEHLTTLTMRVCKVTCNSYPIPPPRSRLTMHFIAAQKPFNNLLTLTLCAATNATIPAPWRLETRAACDAQSSALLALAHQHGYHMHGHVELLLLRLHFGFPTIPSTKRCPRWRRLLRAGLALAPRHSSECLAPSSTILQPCTRPIQILAALTRPTKHPKVPEPNTRTTSQTVLDDVAYQQSQPHRNHPVHPGTFRITLHCGCQLPTTARV